MDLGDQAEAAIKREDHKTAARLYHAMAKAVPDTAVGFRKACEQYELAKDLTTASEFCAAALTLEGVKLSDYLRYGAVVFAKPGAPTPADVGNLDKAVAKLKDSEETRAAGLEIQCTLGFRLSDQARLQECAPALAALAPDSPKSTFFDWALALKKKEFGAAERLLEKARAAEKGGAGLGKKQLALMEQATSEAMPIWRKGFRDWRVGASIALALFAGLGVLLSKRRATVQSEAAAQT
jgi:hypothetical protein